MNATEPHIELILVSVEQQATAVPETQRLKALLKAALRLWGFRCLSVRTIDNSGWDCSERGNGGGQ
jgi:hypothetical protein